MKYFIQSPDAAGNIDPSIQKGLLDFLPGRVTSEAEADCVIVPVAYMTGYRFNEDLWKTYKPIVVLDFLEFGWDAGDKANLLGNGDLKNFGHLSSVEWTKLDLRFRDAPPPALTFKRELFKRDQSPTLLPIEFPCRLPEGPLQSREEFEARPIEVFHCFGLSNPARPRLHGDIFRNAHDYGIHFIDGWEQDNHFGLRNWATIHSPHYLREPIEEVMRWQSRAKISVSLPGAGKKCFRSAEAPVDSIMALHEDNLSWSFDWIDGFNCIRLRPGNEFDYLEARTHQQGLYDIYAIYRQSQATIQLYRSLPYAIEYVLPAIEAIL